MNQVLVCRIRSDLTRLSPVESVLAEIQHVVAGEVGDLLVSGDGHEIGIAFLRGASQRRS